MKTTIDIAQIVKNAPARRSIGKAIENARKEFDMSSSELAEAIHCSIDAVDAMEAGSKAARSTIQKAVEYLGIEEDDLEETPRERGVYGGVR